MCMCMCMCMCICMCSCMCMCMCMCTCTWEEEHCVWREDQAYRFGCGSEERRRLHGSCRGYRARRAEDKRCRPSDLAVSPQARSPLQNPSAAVGARSR